MKSVPQLRVAWIRHEPRSAFQKVAPKTISSCGMK